MLRRNPNTHPYNNPQPQYNNPNTKCKMFDSTPIQNDLNKFIGSLDVEHDDTL